LLINAQTGEVFVNDVSQLGFSVETGKVESFDFNIVARILLSTDTVEDTKEVNSKELVHKVSIVSNPNSLSPTVDIVMTHDGANLPADFNKGIIITLPTGAQFIEGKELTPSLFTLSGLNASGLAARTQILASGLNVARLNDTQAVLYGTLGGFGLVSAAHAGNLRITVSPAALRVAPNSRTANLTFSSGLDNGTSGVVARVQSGGEIVLRSGTSPAGTSGIVFTIKLQGAKFVAAANSGTINFSGLEVIIPNIYTFFSAANGSGVVDATSGLLTFTIEGTVNGDVTGSIDKVTAINAVIPNGYITNVSADLPVLVNERALVLTARPKLAFILLEQE
jgi:hypothetical protein